MKAGIWISYDLGIRGDYPALYAWLDEHGAKSCGDSVAFLRYEWDGDILVSLKKELLPLVEGNSNAILYVVRPREGDSKGAIGTFLTGRRRGAPWTGFGRVGKAEVDK